MDSEYQAMVRREEEAVLEFAKGSGYVGCVVYDWAAKCNT